MICLHTRKRSTVLFLEPNHEQAHPVAVISIQCRDCGQPFEFATSLLETHGITVSADRRELWVEITEARKGMVQ